MTQTQSGWLACFRGFHKFDYEAKEMKVVTLIIASWTMQLIQCVKLIKLFKSVVSLRPYFSNLRNGSLCISRVALLRIKHGNEQLTQNALFCNVLTIR